MRVAFTLIGGDDWTGGRNYLANLLRVLVAHQSANLEPLLFVDEEVPPADLEPFAGMPGVRLIRSRALVARRQRRALLAALLWGRDLQWRRELQAAGADIVFEAARYFGWRLGVPAIAWIPDFQHRAMPSLFTRAGLLRRELGFRAQVHSGRTIMLSSEHARRACESYYPATTGRAFTVRFAVPPDTAVDAAGARQVADHYALPERFFYMPNQFWQHKNHLLVLEALAMLQARGLRPVIAASGRQADPRSPGYAESVLAAARARGLDFEFRPLGLVPREHVTALMISCAALVNPSRYEGWSTTVEEARSQGTPLLLSDLPVHREQAGTSATYFDPDSAAALATALGDFVPATPQDRQRARQEAQEAAAQRVAAFAEDFVRVARHCLTAPSAVH